MSSSITIDSEVPFGRALYAWLALRNLHLDRLVQHGEMEKRYLAWETVRKQTNPFFEQGTGFEGYLVGYCPNPEAALETVLAVNQHILDAIGRLYRYQYNFRSRLMKTLLREDGDASLIHIWSEYLGAELARLRVQVLLNPTARYFQAHTYQLARMLPPIVYHEHDGDVTQTYAVGAADSLPADRLAVSLALLKPDQQDAWLVAENIGEFGHPLVRTLLDRPEAFARPAFV